MIPLTTELREELAPVRAVLAVVAELEVAEAVVFELVELELHAANMNPAASTTVVSKARCRERFAVRNLYPDFSIGSCPLSEPPQGHAIGSRWPHEGPPMERGAVRGGSGDEGREGPLVSTYECET